MRADDTDRTVKRMMETDPVGAMVVFGATGDLARLETYPALVGLVARGVLDVPVIGVAYSGWDLDRFRKHAADSLRHNGIDPESAAAAKLLGLLRYVDGDLMVDDTYEAMSREMGDGRNALFYLEVPPVLFGRIAQGIAGAGRADGARIMVEKPFGTDLRSARALNTTLGEFFPEDAVYRVDHWLGLDPLNDVLVARFANSMIEPLLNRDHVESIQITMAESFGVADRGRFYDATGAIRDVVQNHMLQVLASVVADPSDGSGPNSWLDAKSRVIGALRPLRPADVVRGQYDGYRDIDGVAPGSGTEAYVALRLTLDSWRWAGVPIMIRAGKTMPVTATEVSMRFRPVPYDVFGIGHAPVENTLRFRIWPDARISLGLAGKKPGADREPELHELTFAQHSGSDMRPYDRLIGAALAGNHVLFARQETVEAAWGHRRRARRRHTAAPLPAGQLGPECGRRAAAGRDHWHNPAPS